MTRRCELTGKLPMSGQLRSHAENKTKRTFRPNLCEVTLISDTLQRKLRLRISAHALKTVERRGGLDAFLMKASDEELSERCQKLKREVKKAQSEQAGGVERQRVVGSSVSMPKPCSWRVARFADPTYAASSRSMRTSVRSAPQTKPVFVSVILKPARS